MLSDDFFLGTKLYQQKLTDLCKPIMDYMGITHVIYVNIDKAGRIFSVCTHSKWVERFIEEHYYKLDPLMVHPDNIHNGFSFDIASNDQEFKDTLLYDAVIKFNWCNSFAYIEKTPGGGYFGFDFGTTKENYQVINRLINESQIIKKLIRDLNKDILREIQDLEEKKIDFAAMKGDLFLSQRGLVFNEEVDNENKIQLLKETGVLTKNNQEDFLTKVNLSPQEIKCLRAYLRSQRIKIVARELNLAITTVTSYIENIKYKLNCSHKNDLLEMAEILESLGRI